MSTSTKWFSSASWGFHGSVLNEVVACPFITPKITPLAKDYSAKLPSAKSLCSPEYINYVIILLIINKYVTLRHMPQNKTR